MTERKDIETDMTEERINALLDGELDEEAAERLKQDASSDQALARAIIEAYQLQRAMEHVRVERAPASLRRKLRRIPRQERPAWRQPAWVTAFAAVPLVIVAVALMQQAPTVTPEPATVAMQPGFEEPTEAQLEQARQDLAVAFAYIDRVGERAGNEIESELTGEMTDAVAGSVFRTIQHQKIL